MYNYLLLVLFCILLFAILGRKINLVIMHNGNSRNVGRLLFMNVAVDFVFIDCCRFVYAFIFVVWDESVEFFWGFR